MTSDNANKPVCTDLHVPVKISESSVVTSLGNNYEPDTGEPIAFPFRDLHEVLLWSPGEDEFNVAGQPLAQRTQVGSEPLTLMCHDMMGGYNEDRFDQGVLTSDCYRFYDWQYIDIFVYFSHHFVTVPPPCWINAAHANGVTALGTLITEWKEGAARCGKLLEGCANYKALADKLVEMTIYYNFDGWLINIENPIKLYQMPNLVEFIRYLTTELHRHKPGSKVIWYDSVIEDGSLKWQDMLNEHNRMFFDVTDGIFLNYCWTKEKLESSIKNAGSRRQDVFVGVDVFGRNTYFPGGWDTWKSMKVIRERGMSAAIFAPGWVFETLPRDQFLSNQRKFWEEDLHSYLFPHGVASLPFVSNFCQGFGKAFYKFGKAVTCHDWFNQSSEGIQPTFTNSQFSSGCRQGLEHNVDDGYNGGSCLQLRGVLHPDGEAQHFKIFRTAIEADHPLLISVTVKEDVKAADCIVLRVSDSNNIILWSSVDEKEASDQAVTPYGLHESALLSTPSLPRGLEGSKVYGPLAGTDHAALVDVMCGKESGDVDLGGWCNRLLDFSRVVKGLMAIMCGGKPRDGPPGGWCQRFYLLPSSLLTSGLKIEAISAACYPKSEMEEESPYLVKIGHFSICDPSELSQYDHQVNNLRCTEISWHYETSALMYSDGLTTLCATLAWDYPRMFQYFDVYCSGISKDPNHNRKSIPPSEVVFLGRAYCKSYRICHLVVDDVSEGVENFMTFFVQPTTSAGISAPFDKASRIRLISSTKQ